MFLFTNNLNEGRLEGKQTKSRKLGHIEGKDPRISNSHTKFEGWELSKPKSYVNSNWEKLRK